MASRQAGQGAGVGSQVGGSMNPPVLHRLGNLGSRWVYGAAPRASAPVQWGGFEPGKLGHGGVTRAWARFLTALAEVAGRRAGTWGVEEAGAPLPPEGAPPSTEIARHFRFGNQEDAHEFLRYTIDAMQKACLSGYAKYAPPSPPPLTPTRSLWLWHQVQTC